MSKQIHVYNKHKNAIVVQCYEKDTAHKLGNSYKIAPQSYVRVYEEKSTRKIDIEITTTYTSGVDCSVPVSTRFTSGADISWIAKEQHVVQQKYGQSLDTEDPKGQVFRWTLNI